MEKLDRIVEILLNSISKDPNDLDQKLLNSLSIYQSKLPQLKQVLNIAHSKTHVKQFISLKQCKLYHCLECLNDQASSGCCEHDKKITAFEKSYIPRLVRQLQDLETCEIEYKKCNCCRQKYRHDLLSGRNCECPQCFNCIIKNYRKFTNSCVFCHRILEIDEMIEMARQNGVSDIEYIVRCMKCGLYLYESAFHGEDCYVCENTLDD